MNSFERIADQSLIDHVHAEDTGYNADRMAEDSPQGIRDACMGAARDFPSEFWIEPRDWPDWCRENDKNRTWPRNYVDRFTNQVPSHECTCHSLRTNAEGARNRQIGVNYPDGPKKDFRYEESGKFGSVWLSPLSVYAEANPQQWGGANVRQVMEIACRRGFIPDKIQPHDYGFKHTLQGTSGEGNSNQSHGPFVRVSQFPEGWKDTAKWFRPDDVIFAGSYEEAVCLVLHGLHYSVGRNGHAVPWCRFLPDQGMEYEDSYNVYRYDSIRTAKYAWQGGFAIASMTAPDDWMKPAG